eukprot:12408629-Karenia_brevis.AAC.1
MQKLCKALGAKYGEPALGRYLAGSVRLQNWDKFWSPILTTCKTHKADGQVSLRILHSGAGHPWTHVGRFINNILQKDLENATCLHKHSKSVLEGIRNLEVPASVVFIKLDVQDFYMSGNCADLAKHSCEDLERADVIKPIVEHLLLTQYVCVKDNDNEVDARYFRVNNGSGMGQHSSGSIADRAFYRLAELPFASNRQIQAAHDVLFYGRYRDDILIIAHRGREESKYLAFVRELIRRASVVYKVKCESVSSSSCNYLDFTLFKDPHVHINGKLLYKLHDKNTSQKIPLTPTSNHHPNINKSWPVAEVRRIAQLSHSYQQFRADKLRFVNRLKYFFFPEEITRVVEDIDPFLGQRRQRQRPACTWMVLPFSKVFACKQMYDAIRVVHERWHRILSHTGLISEVHVSWRNAAPNLLKILSGGR